MNSAELDHEANNRGGCACGRFTKKCPPQTRVGEVKQDSHRAPPYLDTVVQTTRGRYACSHCGDVHKFVMTKHVLDQSP